MKRAIFMFFVIGVTMIYFGCSENNTTAPELSQSDQIATTLAKTKIPFTDGWAKIVCPPIYPIYPGIPKILPNGKTLVKGIKVRYDMEVESEPLLTGACLWTTNKKIEADMSAAKLWGKIELFVGVAADGDINEAVGKWDITFHGYRDHRDVVIEAVGQGKEGDVKGMVGKWTFHMTAHPKHPDYPCNKFFHLIEGYISI